MDRHLSSTVQMQFMRPRQLEEALRRFPVVYVPFGLIEWHGRHLPLGNDALKAHAILVKCAEQSGGVVYPPFHVPHTRYVRRLRNQGQLPPSGMVSASDCSGHNRADRHGACPDTPRVGGCRMKARG